MRVKKQLIIFQIAVLPAIFTACTKSEFLNAKPDQSLVVPSTLSDYQAILDDDYHVNGASSFGLLPQLGETGADNYYVPDDSYDAYLKSVYRNEYVWAKEVFNGETIYDWDYNYRAIFYANIVLDGIDQLNISPDEQTALDNIRGSALFYRAHIFYQLAQVFADPYDSATATTKSGIPLRLSSLVTEKLFRSSLAETYDTILAEISTALVLLPEKPLYKTRPSKTAAYALLARVYQTMEKYGQAALYADSCLMLQSSLLDYNSLDSTAPFSFPLFNDEVIFAGNLVQAESTPVSVAVAVVDTLLYAQYEPDDLRRNLFFKDFGGLFFLGSYDGSTQLFGGLATDEIYLIRAECRARAGETAAAMDDLNKLLETRWRAGTYIARTAVDAQDALQQILTERRKELCFRGLRWTDLRRLNKIPALAVTLHRRVHGVDYSLPPNDPRYTYPIPDYVIGFNPDMPQNQR